MAKKAQEEARTSATRALSLDPENKEYLSLLLSLP